MGVVGWMTRSGSIGDWIIGLLRSHTHVSTSLHHGITMSSVILLLFQFLPPDSNPHDARRASERRSRGGPSERVRAEAQG